MSDRDFELGGKKFKLSKLDLLKQFHISRKMGPILAELLPSFAEAQKIKKSNLTESETFDQIAKFAGPFIHGISKLSDSDSEFVLFGLLSGVEVQQSQGNWARVSTGTMLMIQDFELPIIFYMAYKSFGFNLSGFIAALPHQSSAVRA